MCPTEYNKSWSDPAKGYLTTLGDKLNPSIQIMWTGDPGYFRYYPRWYSMDKRTD